MMKRILILLALLLPALALADNVSRERAQAVAEGFMNGNTKAGGRQLQLVWRGEKAEANPMAAPAFYVFNAEGGGFVIIAGEDSVTPVLAYSPQKNFPYGPDMPEALVVAMARLEDMVLEKRSAGSRGNAEVEAAWQAMEKGSSNMDTRAREVLLETAEWNQSEPYNNFAPTVDGSQSVTGCVATAAAELMYYYKYPERGHGTLPSYDYTSWRGAPVHIEGYELGHAYEWKRMVPNYAAVEYTTDQAVAVARLMYDLGVSFKMKFNPDGSDADMEPAYNALVKYMDYDIDGFMYYYEVEKYKMYDFIVEDIAAGHPVFMAGGNHAFLADGYSSDGQYIHFNWGWGGTYNGFFHIDSILRDYGTYNEAAIALRPKGQPGLDIGTTLSYYSLGSTEMPVRDTPFYAFLEYVRYIFGSAEVEIALAKYDFDGTLWEILTPTFVKEAGSGPNSFEMNDLVFHTEALPGDYLRPVFREKGGEWVPMQNNEPEFERILLGQDEDLDSPFKYDKEARRITMETYERAEIRLTGDTGADYSSSVQRSGRQVIINTASLPRGHEYLITIVAGSASQEFRFRY